MTCIIGLEHGGKVYMGCDSAGTMGWQVRPDRVRKVFTVRAEPTPVLIGYTESFRMGQILQRHLTLPPRDPEKQSASEWLVIDFIEEVRHRLKYFGYSRISDHQEEGGTFLVGYAGKVWRVGSEFGITSTSHGFDTCGCGEQYALGAMEALAHLNPEARINYALEITAMFCGGVCGPFYVEVV